MNERPRTPIHAGTRHGRLVVEGPAPRRRRIDRTLPAWWCVCDCGERVSVAADNLRRDNTRSCGCLGREAKERRRLAVPVGERFGRLVVEGPGPDGAAGESRWLCRCDCGTPRAVYAHDLKRGHTKTCGCRRKSLWATAIPTPVT